MINIDTVTHGQHALWRPLTWNASADPSSQHAQKRWRLSKGCNQQFAVGRAPLAAKAKSAPSIVRLPSESPSRWYGASLQQGRPRLRESARSPAGVILSVALSFARNLNCVPVFRRGTTIHLRAAFRPCRYRSPNRRSPRWLSMAHDERCVRAMPAPRARVWSSPGDIRDSGNRNAYTSHENIREESELTK